MCEHYHLVFISTVCVLSAWLPETQMGGWDISQTFDLSLPHRMGQFSNCTLTWQSTKTNSLHVTVQTASKVF